MLPELSTKIEDYTYASVKQAIQSEIQVLQDSFQEYPKNKMPKDVRETKGYGENRQAQLEFLESALEVVDDVDKNLKSIKIIADQYIQKLNNPDNNNISVEMLSKMIDVTKTDQLTINQNKQLNLNLSVKNNTIMQANFSQQAQQQFTETHSIDQNIDSQAKSLIHNTLINSNPFESVVYKTANQDIIDNKLDHEIFEKLYKSIATSQNQLKAPANKFGQACKDFLSTITVNKIQLPKGMNKDQILQKNDERMNRFSDMKKQYLDDKALNTKNMGLSPDGKKVHTQQKVEHNKNQNKVADQQATLTLKK